MDVDMVEDSVDDIQYCVLDYTDKQNPDYYFMPLVFLEEFNAPAVVLDIAGKLIKMPIDWSIIICDAQVGEPEIIPLTALNDRGFTAFSFNPLSSFMPGYSPVRIVDVYNEVKWYVPKLKNGHILAVPITDGDKPECIYFVKETNKVPEVLNIGHMV